MLDLPRRVLEAIVSEIVAPSEGDIETFPALAPHARALGRELGEGLDEMSRRVAARGFRGLQRGDPSSPEHTLLLLLAAHNGGRVVVSRLIRWALEDPTVQRVASEESACILSPALPAADPPPPGAPEVVCPAVSPDPHSGTQGRRPDGL